MPLSPIYVPPKQSSGGGLFGKIIGGLAGLAAAPFTGGASIPAAIGATAGLMGAGSMIGGLIGEGASPSEYRPGGGVSTLNTAIKADPMAQASILSDAQKSLKSYPIPFDQAQELWSYYDAAKKEALKRSTLGS